MRKKLDKGQAPEKFHIVSTVATHPKWIAAKERHDNLVVERNALRQQVAALTEEIASFRHQGGVSAEVLELIGDVVPGTHAKRLEHEKAKRDQLATSQKRLTDLDAAIGILYDKLHKGTDGAQSMKSQLSREVCNDNLPEYQRLVGIATEAAGKLLETAATIEEFFGELEFSDTGDTTIMAPMMRFLFDPALVAQLEHFRATVLEGDCAILPAADNSGEFEPADNSGEFESADELQEQLNG